MDCQDGQSRARTELDHAQGPTEHTTGHKNEVTGMVPVVEHLCGIEG